MFVCDKLRIVLCELSRTKFFVLVCQMESMKYLCATYGTTTEVLDNL